MKKFNKNVIIIIDNYYGDYLLLLMIIGYCNKTNCSSVYKGVIRPFFKVIFFYDKIPQALKSAINILVFFQIKFRQL